MRHVHCPRAGGLHLQLDGYHSQRHPILLHTWGCDLPWDNGENEEVVQPVLCGLLGASGGLYLTGNLLCALSRGVDQWLWVGVVYLCSVPFSSFVLCLPWSELVRVIHLLWMPLMVRLVNRSWAFGRSVLGVREPLSPVRGATQHLTIMHPCIRLCLHLSLLACHAMHATQGEAEDEGEEEPEIEDEEGDDLRDEDAEDLEWYGEPNTTWLCDAVRHRHVQLVCVEASGWELAGNSSFEAELPADGGCTAVRGMAPSLVTPGPLHALQ